VGSAVVLDLRELFNDLIRFEIELWNAVDARLKSEFGLPLAQFGSLSVIGRLPGCRVFDIARELGITTGGMSKLVDRIEVSGYCRRLANPDDRRSSLLELTDEGKRLLAEAGAAVDDELQRWVGSVVPERTLRQFASTLARLRVTGERTAMEEGALPGLSLARPCGPPPDTRVLLVRGAKVVGWAGNTGEHRSWHLNSWLGSGWAQLQVAAKGVLVAGISQEPAIVA
jgi:DNA-binding MarR family transcriptional regulator